MPRATPLHLPTPRYLGTLKHLRKVVPTTLLLLLLLLLYSLLVPYRGTYLRYVTMVTAVARGSPAASLPHADSKAEVPLS